MEYYPTLYDEELYHYGVKGMKWGIRRNNRVIINATRNDIVRKAKRDYNTGKISERKKKSIIADANAKRKSQLKSSKEELKNIKDKKTLEKMKQRTTKEAYEKSPAATASKVAHTINHVITGLDVGSAAVLSAAAVGAAIVNPALAPSAAITVGSMAYRSAVQLGMAKLRGMAIDKLT